jgi:type IV pilus assembly protein PilW
VDTSLFNLLKKDGSVANLRKYLVHVYYVSPCSVPTNGSTCSSSNTDDGGVSIPTLKRMELSVSGGVPQFTSVPLVEGIENMQIDYGLDDDDESVPEAFVTNVTEVSEWPNVAALRVNLLARNNERSPGYSDSKTYNLGLAGSTTATNDAFKRHVFSQFVRVVNPSSRRER